MCGPGLMFPAMLVHAVIVRKAKGFVGYYTLSNDQSKLDRIERNFLRLETMFKKKIFEKRFHGTLNELISENTRLNQINSLPGVRSEFSNSLSLFENYINVSAEDCSQPVLLVA